MDGEEELLPKEVAEKLEAEHGDICVIPSKGNVFAFRPAKKEEARLFRSRAKSGSDLADEQMLQACVVYASNANSPLEGLNQHLDRWVFSGGSMAGRFVKFCGLDPKGSMR